MKKELWKVVHFVRTALFCQLFLLLFSWPLVLEWGLPLSLLTIVGNIIWVPVISIFLAVAVFIFFVALCGGTCPLAITILEYITDWWLYGLFCAQKSVLCAFVCPPWWVLVLMPMSAFVVAWYWRKSAQQWRGCGVFMMLLCAWGFLLKMYALSLPFVTECSVRGKKVLLVRHHGAIVLVDVDGAFAQTTALKKWARYTLAKECHKKHGVITCSAVIELVPTDQRLGALLQLSKQCGPLTVYVPFEHRARAQAWLATENTTMMSVAPLTEETVEKIKTQSRQERQNLWYTIEKVLQHIE